MLQVVWFKRDLRLHDHSALSKAASSGPVLPLVVVEPEYWQCPDVSARQYRWWTSCVAALARDIADLGGTLQVEIGRVVDVLDSLRRTHGPIRLIAHQETGNWWTYQRDIAVREWCTTSQTHFVEPMQHGVWRGSSLDRNKWSKMWDRMMAEPLEPVPSVQWLATDGGARVPLEQDLGITEDPIVWLPDPGHTAACQVLRSFLYERGRDYRTDMSSPVLGAEGCSRLSPYLAVGAISIRQCYQETLARQRELAEQPTGDAVGWRASMRAFVGRLHWHCHFTQKLETDPEIEFRPAVRAYEGMRPASDPVKLAAFAEGRTGYPFVDACMRQLRATGWINFRMRAMLMSFACYDLFLRWQDSGNVLARLFTDYDAGIHWPQSQMQSGESGINTLRIYNPIKQGRDHDPEGSYIRQWVPELAHLDGPALHEPWLYDPPAEYPPPLVNHEVAVKASRNAIWEVRRQPDVRAAAAAVAERHGSRRRPSRKGRSIGQAHSGS